MNRWRFYDPEDVLEFWLDVDDLSQDWKAWIYFWISRNQQKIEGGRNWSSWLKACTWRKKARVLVGGMEKKMDGYFGSLTHSLTEARCSKQRQKTLREEEFH